MTPEITPGPLLAQVEFPADLRRIPEEQLVDFCADLRRYIIEHCAAYGGHFAASLGVVELTAALHYVYDTPADQLVWDVGHQAYGHKIITGRRGQFHTNRLYKGVAGFPKRAESEYDAFGVGHSSTSISAATGMAEAFRQLGQNQRKAVAVIGDGAMTGGMAFEALNHAGAMGTDLLVVLNDNCMSIDANVGALNSYLTDIASSHTYNRLRKEVWNLLGRLNGVGETARHLAAKLEDALLAYSKPGGLFEALGFRYFGPVDGHDVNHLVRLTRDLRELPGPKLLHCVTVKGKGFAPAEADQTKWHAPSFNFDALTGAALKPSKPAEAGPPKYQDVAGDTLIELAEMNRCIVAVTPAMLSGSGLVPMHRLMPERCIDVSIAEQHAVTFSAGMATQGLLPYCCIYSTFLQRGYDQLIHDVAIQNLKVIFCLDRAGLVGADGPTHHGAYDLAYLRAVPNMIVAAPMNEKELRNLMYTAQTDAVSQPMAIRYPRGQGVLTDWQTPFEAVEIGRGRLLTEGMDVAVLSVGHIGNLAAKAVNQLKSEGIDAAHYDMRFVKPLDEELLHEVFAKFSRVITLEDGCLPGGFGSAVAEFVVDNGYSASLRRLGIPDRVVQHGTQAELYAECGYDAAAVIAAAQALLGAVAAR